MNLYNSGEVQDNMERMSTLNIMIRIHYETIICWNCGFYYAGEKYEEISVAFFFFFLAVVRAILLGKKMIVICHIGP